MVGEFSYTTLSVPPPVAAAGGSTNESTPAPSVDTSWPEVPALVGQVATLVPLELKEINPLPLLNIPVSKSSVNVIEGTEAVPSGNVPPAFK